jgi:hypothetical protein
MSRAKYLFAVITIWLSAALIMTTFGTYVWHLIAPVAWRWL